MNDPQPYIDVSAEACDLLQRAYQRTAALLNRVDRRPSTTFQRQSLEEAQEAIAKALGFVAHAERAHRSRHHLDDTKPVPPIVEAVRAQQKNADAFHERTGRCLGDDHANCAHTEVMHHSGDHHWCLPASQGSECEALAFMQGDHPDEPTEIVGTQCRFCGVGLVTDLRRRCSECASPLNRVSQTDDLHAHDWPEVALDGSTAPRCVICGVEWQPEEDSLLVVDGVTGKTYVGTKADVDRENARYKSPDQPAQRAQWLAQQAPMDYLIATHGRCEVCSAPRTVIDHSTHAGQMQKTLVCSTDLGHVDRRDQPRTDGRRSAQMTDEETEAALAALPPRSDGRRAEWDLLSPDGKVQSRLAGTEFVPLTLEQRVTTLEANVRALNARPIYYGQGDPNR